MVKQLTDSLVASAFVNGNIDAFNTLYFKYNAAVFANICKIIRQENIAEDILQDVFLSLWNNRSNFKDHQSIPGWLFVVSYNRSINYLKKALSEKRIAAYIAKSENQLVENNQDNLFELQIDMVNDAINQLPERKKQAFILCKLEGKSYAEAAQLMGVSSETIKEYLKSSFKFIKKKVLNNYDRAAVSGLTFFFLFLQS